MNPLFLIFFISISLFTIISGVIVIRHIGKNIKQDREYYSLLDIMHNFVWNEKYIAILLDKIYSYATNFCIENNIPLYETYCDKEYFMGRKDDNIVAGRITYYQGKEITRVVDPIIEINAYYYNNLVSKFKKSIVDSLKVHTLCHEIGHYIELTTKGESTEDGANWEAAKFASSCLNNTQIWILTRASLFFQDMKKEDAPDIMDWIKDPENKAELLQEYNTYKEIV